jgi:hypothetical protein
MPNKENEFELDLATRAYIADLAMEAQRLTSMRLGALNLVVRAAGTVGSSTRWVQADQGGCATHIGRSERGMKGVS